MPLCSIIRAAAHPALLAAACMMLCPQSALASGIEFNRDIRPILSDQCIACHGPDSAARAAGLRLDQREVAVESGAIVPGDPDASEMMRRILSHDEYERMPPPELKKSVTKEQIALLQEWIRQGAEYQPHWSYIPPQKVDPPKVDNQEWVRNPIDQFVLAELETLGLEPAGEATPETLIRRLSLDLTGLPPSPELVAEYAADPSEENYGRIVDRLLATKAWGEHRGRYWLDAARYADTHGLHFDNYREMWTYRDWVIDAFNRNMPFDQFTIENLAGDLLPDATLAQQIGSGFNRCNVTTNEGGIIDEEYLVLYARDRTETTSTVWLGLTTGCAACHDHKFDPVSQREFYQLTAFFNNTTQQAKDGNTKETPPILAVPNEGDRDRWQQLVAEATDVDQQLKQQRRASRDEFNRWLAKSAAEELKHRTPSEKLALHAPLNGSASDTWDITTGGQQHKSSLPEVEGPFDTIAVELNGEPPLEVSDRGDYDGSQAYSVSAWVKVPEGGATGALLARMDEGQAHRGWDFWLAGRQVGGHLSHSWPDDALKAVTKEPLPADQWTHIALVYDGSRAASGLRVYVNGEPAEMEVLKDQLKGTTQTQVPLKVGARTPGAALRQVALQDLYLYDRALSESEIGDLAHVRRFRQLVEQEAGSRKAEEVDQLYSWWLPRYEQSYKQLLQREAELGEERDAIEQRGSLAHVMHERDEPAMAYLLNRGEYDQRLDEVRAATPEALPPLPDDAPRNRLGLAEWLVADENPLTARVTVNRFWQQVFGQGIVQTAGDFGVSGGLPSHPELLDWLAIEFRDSGWDVKLLFKLIVTSSTYRQSAVLNEAKRHLDPDNRYLSRGPRFRMDAEMVRDYSLAASGLLSPKIGGPSVKPYQPAGVWEAVAMKGSNTRDYRRDEGEALYRRSLYTFWKRSAPPASMEIFDAPSREHCVVVRERTNTPLQALALLNDPQHMEAARHIAAAALDEGGTTDASRLQFVAWRLLLRELTEAEVKTLEQSVQNLIRYYQANPKEAGKVVAVGESPQNATHEPGELAAWTLLVSEMMNLDETINK